MSFSQIKQKEPVRGQRKMFTPQEDAIIVLLVKQYGKKNWKLIAQSLPNRTTRQVRERFRNYLSPELINGPWTKEEDDRLKKLYKEIGPKWSQISTYFKNRSDVNIKNRWSSISKIAHNVSSPEMVSQQKEITTNSNFTPNEGNLFEQEFDFDTQDNAPYSMWNFDMYQ